MRPNPSTLLACLAQSKPALTPIGHNEYTLHNNHVISGSMNSPIKTKLPLQAKTEPAGIACRFRDGRPLLC